MTKHQQSTAYCCETTRLVVESTINRVVSQQYLNADFLRRCSKSTEVSRSAVHSRRVNVPVVPWSLIADTRVVGASVKV